MGHFTDRKDIRSAIQNVSWWKKRIEEGRIDDASLEKYAMWYNYIEAERLVHGTLSRWRPKKVKPTQERQVIRTQFVSSVEAPRSDWTPEQLQWG